MHVRHTRPMWKRFQPPHPLTYPGMPIRSRAWGFPLLVTGQCLAQGHYGDLAQGHCHVIRGGAVLEPEPKLCFPPHPSRQSSNDSLLLICKGICIVSLTLFLQAQLPIPGCGPPPPRQAQVLRDPQGVPGTSGLWSHLSPPESIPEFRNSAKSSRAQLTPLLGPGGMGEEEGTAAGT